MDPICPECTYDYRGLSPVDAPSVLRREACALAEEVGSREPIPAVPEGSWSAIEYAGHVRDVLVVTRERTLNARRESEPVVITMGPNERVSWREYEGLTSAQLSTEIRQVAEWLAHTWDNLPPDDWNRTLLYNYPETQLRPLSWLAAHVVHELVHHRLDIEQLTVQS